MFLAICISVILWISIWFSECLRRKNWYLSATINWCHRNTPFENGMLSLNLHTLHQSEHASGIHSVNSPLKAHCISGDKPSWLLFQFAHWTGKLPQKYTRKSKMKRQSWLKGSAQPAQPLPACPAPITTASERARAAPEAPAQWSRPLPHEGREDPLAAVTDPLPQGVKPRNAQLPVLPARLNPLLLSRVRC